MLLDRTTPLKQHNKVRLAEFPWLLKAEKAPIHSRVAPNRRQTKPIMGTRARGTNRAVPRDTQPTLQWISHHLIPDIQLTQAAPDRSMESRQPTIRMLHHLCELSQEQTHKKVTTKVYLQNAQKQLCVFTLKITKMVSTKI